MSTQVQINDVPPKTQITATAGQTVFTTNWTANAASDVVVYARTSAQTPDDLTQLVSNANYTVAFVGGSEIVEVTFLVARALGDVITITRDTPADRLNLYTNTNFTPSMINQDVGILTLVDQQAQLYNNQVAPHYNVSSTPDLGNPMTGEGGDIYLPILEANQVWVKNPSNTAIAALNVPSGPGLAPSDATYIIQTPWSPSGELPYAQPLSPLASGFMTSANGTGVVSTRTLQGTVNQIDITNGNGAGNPAFSLSSTLQLPGTMTFGGNVDANGYNISNINQANIGNIQISGNTIISTDTNGNINLTPDGTGDLVLYGLNWPQSDGTNGQAITTDGAGQLGWSTVSTVTTPTTDKAIARFNGTGGALQNSDISIPSSKVIKNIQYFEDINGLNTLEFVNVPSAVNWVKIANQATNLPPEIQVGGSDANIGLNFRTKGAAGIQFLTAMTSNQFAFYSGTAYQHDTKFNFPNTAATQIVTWPDLTGTVALSGTAQSVSFGSLSLTTPLGISSGGTNTSTLGSSGQLAQSDGTKYSWTTATYPATATATGTILRSDGTNWVATTATYPATTTINQILYSSANNTIGQITAAIGSVLVSDATGAPSMIANPADNYRVLMSKNADTPVWSTAAYPNTASANGTLMQSNGTNWTHTTATYPSSTNKDHILYSSANNTVGEITTQKNAVLVSDNSNTPQWSGSLSDGQIIIGKTNALPAAANLTAGTGMSIVNAANSITLNATGGTVNSGTANQLAYYATTGTAVSGLTSANSATLVTNASGVPAWTGSMTNGQVLIGSTGATPVLGTITGTSGISVSNGAGTITISGTGSGIGWNEVTGTTQAMAQDTGYVSSNAAKVVFTLPTTAAFGTVVNVVGKGAGGWKIAQNAGQNIQLGSSSSTVGVAGYIESTNRYDSIELLCTTANTTWTVLGGPQGNITVA